MRYGLPALGLTVLLLGWSVPAGRVGSVRAPADLDSFGPERLERDLRDELDDILEDNDSNEDIDLDEMFDEIMFALGDEGDEDDPEESEISLQDLEDEIAELGDGTTLDDVVREALATDQAAAGGFAAGLATQVGAGLRTTPSWVWTETAEPRTVGVSRATRGVLTAIRAR